MTEKRQDIKFSPYFFAIILALFFCFILVEVFLDQVASGIKMNFQNNIVITPTVTPTPNPNPVVIDIKDGDQISSPLIITGQVDSSWMFEGQFSVKLLDINKKIIIHALGKEITPGSWMKPGKVDFTSTITFKPTSKPAYLVFEADNPSGLPENAKSFTVSVTSKIPTDSAFNKMCGGIANIKCPDGYKCVLDGNYPDASGKCQTINE